MYFRMTKKDLDSIHFCLKTLLRVPYWFGKKRRLSIFEEINKNDKIDNDRAEFLICEMIIRLGGEYLLDKENKKRIYENIPEIFKGFSKDK